MIRFNQARPAASVQLWTVEEGNSWTPSASSALRAAFFQLADAAAGPLCVVPATSICGFTLNMRIKTLPTSAQQPKTSSPAVKLPVALAHHVWAGEPGQVA